MLVLACAYCLYAGIASIWVLRPVFRARVSLSLAVATAVGAMVGGRLFHVVFERPELLARPAEIFGRWDGLTFYGAFLGAACTLALVLYTVCASRSAVVRACDWASVACAFGYGVLRLGCYANGCCWGRLSSAPWAVRYYESPYMPFAGVPVHPVQLYDSALGFALGFALWRLMRLGIASGRLPWLFCCSFGVGRFATESFRGDAYRGVDAWTGLSTSQGISAALDVAGIAALVVKRSAQPRRGVVAAIALAVATVLTGCVVPQPPDESTYESIDRSREEFVAYVGRPRARASTRNALFFASDAIIQESLRSAWSGLYPGRTPPRIEELAWWRLAPLFDRVYTRVLVTPADRANYASIVAAIRELERRNEPYDAYFLTHGFPNHLSDGRPGYALSWRELQAWRGRVTNLNAVFMQACFGQSLASDWLAAGARAVVAFDGLNRDVFFVEFFLRWLGAWDLEAAFHGASGSRRFHLETSAFHQSALRALGLSVDEYLDQAPPAILTLGVP